MANKNLTVAAGSDNLPKRGPNWTFYTWSIFAVLTVIAIVFGFLHAGTLH